MPDTAEQTRRCKAAVGATVVAFALRERDPGVIARVVAGDHTLTDEQQTHLAALDDAVSRLGSLYGEGMVNTCLFGQCSALDGNAAILALHDGDLDAFERGVRSYEQMQRDPGYR